MTTDNEETANNACHDCGVPPGFVHLDGCDVSRCTECGRQRISCEEHDEPGQRWTGLWPGLAECREYGWYAKLGPDGWVRCDRSDPQAFEDLNRLGEPECRWDKARSRWVRRDPDVSQVAADNPQP